MLLPIVPDLVVDRPDLVANRAQSGRILPRLNLLPRIRVLLNTPIRALGVQ